MLVDKQNELMSDLLFTIHQYGGDDVTWKPPIRGRHWLSQSLALLARLYPYLLYE